MNTFVIALYVSVQDERIETDPHQLYQQLLVAGMGSTDLSNLLQYELCSFPPSLFDLKLLMSSGDKSELQKGVIKSVPQCAIEEHPPDVVFILDGGTLLQRLPWPKGATYGELCHSYIHYVQRHYKKVLVVFDGYNSEPTIKDEAHKKRHRNVNGADVDIRKQLVLRMNKPAFLANAKNKQKYIFLLGEELENCPNIQVRHSEGDADYDIVMSACAVAMSHPVVVVEDDIDLLILLQYHFILGEHQASYLYMTTKLVDITALKRGLSPELSHLLLFTYVLTGCDTTSRPCGIGKTSALNKYPLLYEYSNVFLNATQSKSTTEKTGNQALAVLYGDTAHSRLDTLRASKFSQKVVTSS